MYQFSKIEVVALAMYFRIFSKGGLFHYPHGFTPVEGLTEDDQYTLTQIHPCYLRREGSDTDELNCVVIELENGDNFCMYFTPLRVEGSGTVYDWKLQRVTLQK